MLGILFTFTFPNWHLEFDVNWISNNDRTVIYISFRKCTISLIYNNNSLLPGFMCGELPSINIRNDFLVDILSSAVLTTYFILKMLPVSIRHSHITNSFIWIACAYVVYFYFFLIVNLVISSGGCYCLLFYNGRVWFPGILNSHIAYNGIANV